MNPTDDDTRDDCTKLSAEMLLQDAQGAIEERDLEGALEFLRMAAEFDPARIEFEGPWIS